MEGKEAIGYLKYQGAKTEKVPNRFVYMHFPKFVIIQKICSVMNSSTTHQRLGLEKRGVSQMDPRFASEFVDYLVKNELAETRRIKGRDEMVSTTSKGRDILGRFCNSNNEALPDEIEQFIEANLPVRL